MKQHQNELEAAQLLLHVHTWRADVVVVWRIDTELVSPIETLSLTPWKYPRRIYVPYLQNGGSLNDRFLLGHPNAIASLIASRASLIASDCTFGEPAMIRLVKTLDLTVSFTRTRVVRRRFDLATTSSGLSLYCTFGQNMNRFFSPSNFVFGLERVPMVVVRGVHRRSSSENLSRSDEDREI